MGFTDNEWMFNRGHPNSMVAEGNGKPAFGSDPGKGRYTTDWLTDRALEWVDAVHGDAPFCLMVSYPDPHTPYQVREPYASVFDPASLTLPPTFQQRDVPDWVAKGRERYADVFGNGIDDPEREANLRRHKAAYCGMVRCLDDNVGRLLDHLGPSGRLDDTVVVYTADHGDYMGEHGLFGKGGPYISAFRVPLLVRWPGHVPAGLTVDAPLGGVDVAPTILGLLGMPASGREEGADASTMLRGGAGEGFTEAHCHHQSFARANLITERYNLALVSTGACLLFDLIEDPDEQHNLYGEPAHAETIIELSARVAAHHAAVQSPAAVWTRGLSRAQQDLHRQGKPLQ
jgi:uncharacterized sulfatase